MSLDLLTDLFPYNRLEIPWRCNLCGYDDTNPKQWKGALTFMRPYRRRAGVGAYGAPGEPFLRPVAGVLGRHPDEHKPCDR